MIKIIAAIGDNRELGYMNDLPWPVIVEDMKQFMLNTMKDTLIMGRLTWDSLDSTPLPGRTMVVISRKKLKMPKGHFWYSSPEEAMRKHPDAWVIGGSSLFAHALPIAKEMLISYIYGTFNADVYFPKWEKEDWEIVAEEYFDEFRQVHYVKR